MKEVKFGNQSAIDTLDFGSVFKHARMKAGGAGSTFTWRGQKYTTDYAEEDWSPTHPKKKKTASVEKELTDPTVNELFSTETEESGEYEPEDVEVDEDYYDVPSPADVEGTGLTRGQKGAIGLLGGLSFAKLVAGRNKHKDPRYSPPKTYGEIFNERNTVPKTKGFTLGEGSTTYTGPSRPARGGALVVRSPDLVDFAVPINPHYEPPTMGRTIGTPRSVYRAPGGLLPMGTIHLGPGKLTHKSKLQLLRGKYGR